MVGKSANQSQPQTHIFKPLLAEFIDMKQELVILSQKIDWSTLEKELGVFYANFGAPSKPIRLMAGVLMLKQMFNKSDERIVEEWSQNPYYQYFTGNLYFEWGLPFDPSDLVHFRNRIGQQGVGSILKASQQLHRQKIEKATEVIIDTTVQEKNITFPTDNKLALKVIDKTLSFVDRAGIKLKQTFSKELKDLKISLRFSHHPKRRKQARKASRRLKTIAGILVREVDRKQTGGSFDSYRDGFLQVLAQTRTSKNKVYSLHEPQAACIAKGKAHRPFEFGSKISIAILPGSNVVVDVSHFPGNPHDSTTLAPVLERIREQLHKVFDYGIVDRGYRGKKKVGDTYIVVPNPKEDRNKSTDYQSTKRRQCTSRAAIEPVISHIKHDCRMLRNFLKGVLGDQINAIMAGAAFNLRLALKEIKQATAFRIRIFCFVNVDRAFTIPIVHRQTNHKKLIVTF